MTVAENASLRLSCFTFQTHFYLQYKNVTSKKRARRKQRTLKWLIWVDLFGKSSDWQRLWQELERVCAVSLILLFKGRKSSAYNQLNNNKKRMIQVSSKLFQTGGFSIKTALAAICQEISGVDRMTLVHQPELWQAKNVSYVRVSTWWSRQTLHQSHITPCFIVF